MVSTVQTRKDKFLKPIRVEEFGFSTFYPICSMESIHFMYHIALVVWIVSISNQCIFSVKHQLTISLWQSLKRSLSSFVFPIPAPVPFPFVVETKRAQLIDNSSNTDRSIFSAFGSSSSLRACTSDRLSSWGKLIILQHHLVLKEHKLFFVYHNEIKPYDQQQALSSSSKVLNIIPQYLYSLCSDNIKHIYVHIGLAKIVSRNIHKTSPSHWLLLLSATWSEKQWGTITSEKHFSIDFKMTEFFLIWPIFCALICIVYIKKLKNALTSTGILLLWYSHLHVLADNTAIVRVTFLF